jgi:hypothetical protein
LRSILLASELFLQELVRRYGKHPVSTDRGGRICIHMLVIVEKIKHIIFIHSMRESSLSEQFNTLKIEQNVLMIIFHV